MVLKILRTSGPMSVNAAMTTIATRTSINAYSTIPCPRSLSKNNILLSPFFKIEYRAYYTHFDQIYNYRPAKTWPMAAEPISMIPMEDSGGKVFGYPVFKSPQQFSGKFIIQFQHKAIMIIPTAQEELNESND